MLHFLPYSLQKCVVTSLNGTFCVVYHVVYLIAFLYLYIVSLILKNFPTCILLDFQYTNKDALTKHRSYFLFRVLNR